MFADYPAYKVMSMLTCNRQHKSYRLLRSTQHNKVIQKCKVHNQVCEAQGDCYIVFPHDSVVFPAQFCAGSRHLTNANQALAYIDAKTSEAQST